MSYTSLVLSCCLRHHAEFSLHLMVTAHAVSTVYRMDWPGCSSPVQVRTGQSLTGDCNHVSAPKQLTGIKVHLIGETNTVHSICHFLPWCVSCGVSVIVILWNVLYYFFEASSSQQTFVGASHFVALFADTCSGIWSRKPESPSYFCLFVSTLYWFTLGLFRPDSVKLVLEFTSDAQLSGIWHHEGTSCCDYPNCVIIIPHTASFHEARKGFCRNSRLWLFMCCGGGIQSLARTSLFLVCLFSPSV